MLEELARLRVEYWVLSLVAAAATARTVALYWWKARRADLDLAFEKALLEQQFSAADVARLIRARKTRRSVVVIRPPAPGDVIASPQPQNVEDSCPGIVPPPAALPLAGFDVAASGASFGEWYRRRFAGIPLVAQLLMWLIYGFVWILLWYALSMACRSTPETARTRPGPGFYNFVGAALFVAVLFASISLLVHVSSSGSRRRPDGERLSPESRVVPLASGGEASCRISIGRDSFPSGETLELTALVISRSDPTGELRVRITPDRCYLSSSGPCHVTATLHSLAGTGDFTVQVRAGTASGRHAETVFTVQVRPPAPAGPTRPLDE